MRHTSVIGFRGRIISPRSPHEVVDWRDGLLVVAAGKIVACGPAEEIDVRVDREVNLAGYLIIPGLVDCHSHIPQLDCRGKHGATLLTWLEQYIFPAERAFADLRVAEHVATRFFKKLILNGTTTAALYTTVHAAATDRCFEIAQAAGMRVIMGKVMMDQHSPAGLLEETHAALSASEQLCAKWHGQGKGKLFYAFTPRFAPTCSHRLWEETGKLRAAGKAYVQTHIAETLEENARVRELFPECHDPFALLETTGCAAARTILGHAIHLDDGAFRRIAASGSSLAHCPTSNFFLKSGAFPLARAERAGVSYGLGTDVGAGTSLSLFNEMRQADFTQVASSVTPVKAFYLATLGGAKALSLAEKVGSFEIGKQADFVVIDIAAIEPSARLADLTSDEILSLLVYRGDGRAITACYVDGEKLDVDAF